MVAITLRAVKGSPLTNTELDDNQTTLLNETIGTRSTVASHATTADIWTATGRQIDWTGTATTTALPNAPQAGATKVLICASTCAFTAGANMLIEGFSSGQTITMAANDTVTVEAISTTQFRLAIRRYSGVATVVAASNSTVPNNYAQFGGL